MQPATMNKQKNLVIGLCVALIIGIGLVLMFQSKIKNELEQNLEQKTAPRKVQSDNQLVDIETTNKANAFLKTIKESLRQAKDFPFQPTWSGEVYDPEQEVDENYQKALQTHVMLRNFYTSEVRLSPEFLEMHKTLTFWGIDPDPIQCIQLFDALRMLESVDESLDTDPKLTPPQTTIGLQKIKDRRTAAFAVWIKNTFSIESTEFLEKLKMIKPKDSFGVPDTRIEPFEPLLIN